MANTSWIMDVTEALFARQVVERSHSTPVLVDFWAPWCGPCRTLVPTLERLAREMNGRFFLAKVNSDENPNLAQKMGIRGIPTVKLFINGVAVREFTGALPENQIRRFLDEGIPSEADRLVMEAQALEAGGNLQRAFALFQAAVDRQPRHGPALLGMARILIAVHKPEQAEKILSMLEPVFSEGAEAKALMAQLAFTGAAASEVDMKVQAADAEPHDLALQMAAGNALVAAGRVAEGLERFLLVMKRDRAYDDDAGRRAILKVFEMLGPMDPRVRAFRPRLSALLFS